jgi:hypothetical protein
LIQVLAIRAALAKVRNAMVAITKKQLARLRESKEQLS